MSTDECKKKKKKRKKCYAVKVKFSRVGYSYPTGGGWLVESKRIKRIFIEEVLGSGRLY